MELKNEAKILIAKLGERPLVHREEIAVTEEDFAGRRTLKAAEHVQQRRFAHAGLADNRDLFAGRRLQVQAAQHGDDAIGIVEILIDPHRAQQRRRAAPAACLISGLAGAFSHRLTA